MDLQKVTIEYITADGKRMHVDVSFEVKGLLNSPTGISAPKRGKTGGIWFLRMA